MYLHYALDLWFEKVVKSSCEADAYLCRFADDYVCLFRHKQDAERFFEALGQRMGKFGLEPAPAPAPDKTKIISFSRFRKREKTGFEFLGFEFRWGVYGNRDMVIRRTSPKKMRLAPAKLTEWCKKNRNLPLKRFFRILNAKFRGYYNYFGVFGNSKSLKRHAHEATRIIFKRHNRRRSKNRQGFKELLKHFNLPRPRIVERLFTRTAAGTA